MGLRPRPDDGSSSSSGLSTDEAQKLRAFSEGNGLDGGRVFLGQGNAEITSRKNMRLMTSKPYLVKDDLESNLAPLV